MTKLDFNPCPKQSNITASLMHHHRFHLTLCQRGTYLMCLSGEIYLPDVHTAPFWHTRQSQRRDGWGGGVSNVRANIPRSAYRAVTYGLESRSEREAGRAGTDRE